MENIPNVCILKHLWFQTGLVACHDITQPDKFIVSWHIYMDRIGTAFQFYINTIIAGFALYFFNIVFLDDKFTVRGSVISCGLFYGNLCLEGSTIRDFLFYMICIKIF